MKDYNRLERFPLYKIVGFIDSEKRINHRTIKTTSLGYIMEYVMEYREQKDMDTLYKPEDWKKILEWIESHK